MESRVIKFRAWHKGMMYNVDTLSLSDKGIDGIGSFAHYERNADLVDSKSCQSFGNNTVFMQYIGLKDRNGKDAYVGNIYKETMLDGTERFYKVFQVKGGFAINTFQDDFKKDHVILYSALADMQNAGWFESCLEEIGNIYQNPDMIC